MAIGQAILHERASKIAIFARLMKADNGDFLAIIAWRRTIVLKLNRLGTQGNESSALMKGKRG
jgi:hypothetical protein